VRFYLVKAVLKRRPFVNDEIISQTMVPNSEKTTHSFKNLTQYLTSYEKCEASYNSYFNQIELSKFAN
jgi:hypothetical protein